MEDATRQTEKQIPLRTQSKTTARERIAEVNKVEKDIKKGMEFSFPWLSDLTTRISSKVYNSRCCR